MTRNTDLSAEDKKAIEEFIRITYGFNPNTLLDAVANACSEWGIQYARSQIAQPETAIEFLRAKGILDSDKTQWLVEFTDGRKFDFVKLLQEFKAIERPATQPPMSYEEWIEYGDKLMKWSLAGASNKSLKTPDECSRWVYEQISKEYNIIKQGTRQQVDSGEVEKLRVAKEAEKWRMEAERLRSELLFRDSTVLPEKDAEYERLQTNYKLDISVRESRIDEANRFISDLSKCIETIAREIYTSDSDRVRLGRCINIANKALVDLLNYEK